MTSFCVVDVNEVQLLSVQCSRKDCCVKLRKNDGVTSLSGVNSQSVIIEN